MPINHLSTNLLPFSVEIELLLSLLWILRFIQGLSTFRHSQSWLLSFCFLSWGECIFGIVPFDLSKTRKKWLWEDTTALWPLQSHTEVTLESFSSTPACPARPFPSTWILRTALQAPRILFMLSIHVFFKLGYDIKTSFPQFTIIRRIISIHLAGLYHHDTVWHHLKW